MDKTVFEILEFGPYNNLAKHRKCIIFLKSLHPIAQYCIWNFSRPEDFHMKCYMDLATICRIVLNSQNIMNIYFFPHMNRTQPTPPRFLHQWQVVERDHLFISWTVFSFDSMLSQEVFSFDSALPIQYSALTPCCPRKYLALTQRYPYSIQLWLRAVPGSI